MRRDYLTIDDVAERLGISRRNAYLLIRKEGFYWKPTHKEIRVFPDKFEAWLRKQKKPVGPR